MILTAALLATAVSQIDVRRPLAEVWVWHELFAQMVGPLAEVPGRLMAEGKCPGLKPDADNAIHTYTIDVKMKSRGVTNRTWTVTDLRIDNPSPCEALDAEVTRYLKEAIPSFAEPRKDENGDGWTRLPRIQLKVVS
jgi:hypothetical protein